MTPRTSITHPLRVDPISCTPFAQGTIGITFCPGKCAPSIYGAPWKRDLDLDVQALQEWGASMALTLIEEHEFHALNVPGLGAAFRQRGIEWHHLPIPDVRAPGEAFTAGWAVAADACASTLRSGGKVLIHCRGGLGRAGTVACLLLRELGASSGDALARVRRARPGAVEVVEQELYLASYVPLGMRSKA